MSRCHLLCEDKAQERLFRPLLERKFGRGRVHVEPRRRVGGWNFVKQNVRKLAQTPRFRRGEAVGLVVVFDGDSKTAERLKEIRALAGLAGQDAWARQVGICIPSRNVETWLLWLTGEDEVDEVQDFKRDVQNRPDYAQLPRRAAEAWFAVPPARRGTEKERLPALVEARRELDRILAIADSR